MIAVNPSTYHDLLKARTEAVVSFLRMCSLFSEMGELLRVSADEPYPTDRIDYSVHELAETGEAMNDIYMLLAEAEEQPGTPFPGHRPSHGWIEEKIGLYREVKVLSDQNYEMLLALRENVREEKYYDYNRNPVQEAFVPTALRIIQVEQAVYYERLVIQHLLRNVFSYPMDAIVRDLLYVAEEYGEAEFQEGGSYQDAGNIDEALWWFEGSLHMTWEARAFLEDVLRHLQTYGYLSYEQFHRIISNHYALFEIISAHGWLDN